MSRRGLRFDIAITNKSGNVTALVEHRSDEDDSGFVIDSEGNSRRTTPANETQAWAHIVSQRPAMGKSR
jgi:hypothetical protein